MTEDKTLKPKSFRIDDETAEKFKEISSTIGGNQQETLAKLIEAFEFQSGKAILTERKADIEQFEKYVTILTRMYMSSLEDNQNITETVRTDFDALLKSKDTTIQGLQESLEREKRIKEEATIKAATYADENTRLNDVIKSLNVEYNSKMDDMQEMLVDKENLNKALADSCRDLKNRVESMTQVTEQMTELKKSFDELQKEYSELKLDFDMLQTKLNTEKTNHEQIVESLRKHEADAVENIKVQLQITYDKALIELEKKYQEQIQQLKSEKQDEVDKYQRKYFELLEQKKQPVSKTISV